MRPIGNLPDREQAELFGDYLLAKGIANEVERGGADWSVWVKDDEQLADAQARLARFRAAPDAAEFRHEAQRAEQVRADQAADLAAFRRRVHGRRRLFPSFGEFGIGWLTYAMLVACGIVAIYSLLGSDKSLLRHLFIEDPQGLREGWLADVRAGEVWRLITPIFIHFGPLHLIFNSLWLLHLGCMIEARRSPLALASMVLAFGICSNLAQLYAHGPLFGGMSGVVYGLFGFVWIRGTYDRASGVFIDRQNVILMIAWFFGCMTGILGPIANVAHAVGLGMGMVWGLGTAWLANRNPR